jgi:hypothetical protein
MLMNHINRFTGKIHQLLQIMANGDVLGGETVEREIQFQTDYGNVPVSFKETKIIQLPFARYSLWSGMKGSGRYFYYSVMLPILAFY